MYDFISSYRFIFCSIKRIVASVSCVALLQICTIGISQNIHVPSLATVNENLRGNGIGFTENKGQVVDANENLRPDILYKGDGGGANIYLRKGGISYVMSRMEGTEEEETIKKNLKANFF